MEKPTTTTPDWSRVLNKICSSVLIPLLIGLATVVISVVQLQIAHNQRAQDLQIATEQRERDLFLSDNAQKDRVLGDYIDQLSRLILKANFNLSDPKIGNICRAKTLTAIRQLDPRRKSYLIKFLYAAQLIRNSQAKISLFEAERCEGQRRSKRERILREVKRRIGTREKTVRLFALSAVEFGGQFTRLINPHEFLRQLKVTVTSLRLLRRNSFEFDSRSAQQN